MPTAPKRGAIRLTLPIVRKTLFDYRRVLLLLLVISAVLSVVPTLKSELESSLISQIDAVLRHRVEATSLSEVAKSPMRNLFVEDEKNTDLPTKLARFLFPKLTVGFALLAYLLIALFTFGLELGATSCKSLISKHVFSAIRAVGLRKGLITDPSKLPEIPNVPGQYAMAIQQGATNVGNTYEYFLDASQELFALGTTLLLVATRSLMFAGCCFLLVLGQVAMSLLQAHRLQRARESLDSKRNNLLGRTDDILAKREIILAFEQQDRYGNKLDTFTREYAEIERNLQVKEEVFRGLSTLISEYGKMIILVVALIITIGLSRSTVTNIGDAYFLISIYVRIFVPSSNLLNRYDSLKRSESTSKTFLGILSDGQSDEATSSTNVVPAKKKDLAIDFRDVSFRYAPEDGPWVLRNCSFSVPANATTLIVGRSGCGKTTIARLVLGFWPPTQGLMLVGDKDINDYSHDDLRLQMSYLSQGDHIVDDTVRENLSWVFPDGQVNDSVLLGAIRDVGLAKSPEEEKDILERQAKDLSLGQQQRLSIARLLLDDSPIQILDEPLTGVDVFTIRDLHPDLVRLLGRHDRTIMMFSHRVAFAAYADHVVVLDGGGVAEQGNPSDLLATHSIFADLYRTALAELQSADVRLGS